MDNSTWIKAEHHQSSEKCKSKAADNTFLEWLLSKRYRIICAGKDVGKGRICTMFLRMYLRIVKNKWRCHKKQETLLLHEAAIPHQSMQSNGRKGICWRDICTLSLLQHYSQPPRNVNNIGSIDDEWRYKMCCIHTANNDIKNEMLPFAKKWMDGILLI